MGLSFACWGALGGCLSLPASVPHLGGAVVKVSGTGRTPAKGGDWHQLGATRRPRAAPVPPPHLCQRAGRPPPGPGGSRASKERGGSQLGQCGCPVAVTLCTSSSGSLREAPVRAWVPRRGPRGPQLLLSPAERREEGTAQLPRAGGRWQASGASAGRAWGCGPAEAAAGARPGVALTSWEFLGELSSRSELCGHRRGPVSRLWGNGAALGMGCGGHAEGPPAGRPSGRPLSAPHHTRSPLPGPELLEVSSVWWALRKARGPAGTQGATPVSHREGPQGGAPGPASPAAAA